MSRLSEALERLKAGRMIILVDDEDRENEGDLVIAAQFADGPAINFMALHGRGLICLSLAGAIVDKLGLAPMVSDNQARRKTAFTVSIEAREGITTGISAYDRAHTIQTAVAPDATAHDIVSPGHVFPLRAVEGGVLKRDGQTEGSVDLMRLAGLTPAAVICEIMNPDGRMARRADLEIFSAAHDIPILSVAEIITHRLSTETLVEEVARAALPTAYSPEGLEVRAFRSLIDGREHVALVTGDLADGALVRVHSECLTGDALGSLRCDCGDQLQASLKLVGESGNGAVIYLRGHEGRGVGLANKIRAYALQDEGMDTVEANHALGFADDLRDYGIAAQIVRALGVTSVRLLSNNPRKAAGLKSYGVEVREEVPLILQGNVHNHAYLAAKRDKLGHRLGPQRPDRSAA
jgi:3,4-dihydroxy 2-butanone 4-phosphate synthase/GTP cyclohydrolase II